MKKVSKSLFALGTLGLLAASTIGCNYTPKTLSEADRKMGLNALELFETSRPDLWNRVRAFHEEGIISKDEVRDSLTIRLHADIGYNFEVMRNPNYQDPVSKAHWKRKFVESTVEYSNAQMGRVKRIPLSYQGTPLEL